MKKYKAIRDFVSPVYGMVNQGQVLAIASNIGEHFVLTGLVEPLEENKPVEQRPKRKPRKKDE